MRDLIFWTLARVKWPYSHKLFLTRDEPITEESKSTWSTSISSDNVSSAACSSISFSEISPLALLISSSALLCRRDRASWNVERKSDQPLFSSKWNGLD